MSPPESLLETPLYSWHQGNGGRLVEFGGWSMPVQYTTIVDEHKAVRERVGLFDISHMGRLTFDGAGVLDWLERVTTNHVARLERYADSIQPTGDGSRGVIDDILVYRQPFAYIVVCNASNRDRVKARFEELRQGAIGNFVDRTLDTAMIAVQGPKAKETLQPLFDQPLETVPYYHFTMGQLRGGVNTVISRTGYTGEDGFEVVVAANAAVGVWNALLESGKPTASSRADWEPAIRYGWKQRCRCTATSSRSRSIRSRPAWAGPSSSTKATSPARARLKDWKAAPGLARVGLKLESKRIARQGAIVFDGDLQVGEVTSGTFSPTLETSLAMALVDPSAAAIGTALAIDVRGHREPAQVVKLPFYKRTDADTRTG